ncbi:hypothetical protein [Hyalangium gracile]|nr:hypothetical protein [Hyalangium gracile]
MSDMWSRTLAEPWQVSTALRAGERPLDWDATGATDTYEQKER